MCDYGPSPPKSQELANVSPGKALRASLDSHKVASNKRNGEQEENKVKVKKSTNQKSKGTKQGLSEGF